MFGLPAYLEQDLDLNLADINFTSHSKFEVATKKSLSFEHS
jgi:hypothetical protein